MKKASLSEWEVIGEQAKKARNELFQLLNDASCKLPISLTNQIIKSKDKTSTIKLLCFHITREGRDKRREAGSAQTSS